jgi:hypothetical protein
MKIVKLLDGINKVSTILAGWTNIVAPSCAFARFVGNVDVDRDIASSVRASNVGSLDFDISFSPYSFETYFFMELL